MKSKINSILLFLFLMISSQFVNAQFAWYNPLDSKIPVVEGRLFDEKNYNRLPENMQSSVRKEVWDLSKNASGLSLSFVSDASEVHVHYTVKGNHQMPHMPATGVSGLDLFVKQYENEWNWVRAAYSFGDTIRYAFRIDQKEGQNSVFKLYLPLYNEIEHISLGVKEEAYFQFLEKKDQEPIVVYGTSIAQGACASRPAMAWTTLLQQGLNSALVNLGFSGNGLLEKEIIDFIGSKNASLYILDCLPNLVPGKGISDDEIRERIKYAARHLKGKNPTTPILFSSHAGYSDHAVDQNRRELVTKLNTILQEEIEKLKKDDMKGIYLLTTEEIGLDQYDFVDGTHPTDRGMFKYAQAYQGKIMEIYQKERK